MGPVVSWLLFITVVGAVFFASHRGRKKPGKKNEPLYEKAKPIVLKVLSGTDGGEAKKKPQQKKKKAKKAAISSTVTKDVMSTDDGGNRSDEEVAEEADSTDVAKRLQNMKQGGKASASRSGGRQANLAPSVHPYAASQTSSTGGDADIDEEELAGLVYSTNPKSSSSDPSDMLEAPTGGHGVLRLGPPIQPPRIPKKKVSSSTSEPGIHASKNAKKKEKKKAERDADRAEQQARFEQHRKAMRAQEASQQKINPVQPQSSAWSIANGKKSQLPAPSSFVPESSSVELLDTFVPKNQSNSHNSSDEKLLKSTTLGDSWETIPQRAMVLEHEWSEVKSKKMRKDKKGDESEANKSADEYKPKPAVVVAEPVKTPKPVQKMEIKKGSPVFNTPNNTGTSNTSTSDTNTNIKTPSSSDWAELDNLENWAVHPESSDF